MARINYPEEFFRQTKLFDVMKAKHDADGPASPLTPFLIQQAIDLTVDETATNSAKDEDILFDAKQREAEKLTKERDKLFDPIFAWMKKELQFLKKFYVGNVKELGDWGVTVDDERIVYPPEFEELAVLFKNIKTKHESFPPSNPSPLGPFLVKYNLNLGTQLADVSAAETKHDQRNQAQRDAEDMREDRDNFFNPVMDHLRKIGQYLKGLNVENPQELGDWGYNIDESPRNPKFRTATIAPDNIRTLSGVKLESQVENTGSIELLLHKGDAVGTEPVNLPPEMRFTIKRGWGTLTVQNPDPTQEGEIGYLGVTGLH